VRGGGGRGGGLGEKQVERETRNGNQLNNNKRSL